MEGERFDEVKYEKAKAMARFKRFQMIKKLWKLAVVVVLLSWTSRNFPAVFKVAGVSLFPVSDNVLNTHVAFLIGNAIILLLLLLCRENTAGSVPVGGNLHSEYSRQRETNQPVSPDRESQSDKVKEMVVVEDVGGGGVEVVEKEKEEEKEEEEEEKMQFPVAAAENEECEAVETAIAEARKQIRRFQRTQSERLMQDIALRPRRRELRRSETETRRRQTITKPPVEEAAAMTSAFDAVNDLSNEEFKLAIDAFIVKHRAMICAQKNAVA